ncbi:MAG TPA: DUF5668 domain-containing protein [Candidatus Aminicenantes bacterium]|nr:DUF5668 domain-containing protein [Acidobacteriota bacterium]HOI45839.1 DUF5668 domain-containing protein [Candidatus Aminicenantes bacterium]
MSKQKAKDNLVWGIILIAIGLVFLLEKFDIEVWDTVAKLWPLILIFWGLSKLYYGIRERESEKKPEVTDQRPGDES